MAACLETLHWAPEDLDPELPAQLANAGAEHLILVDRTHERLPDLDYDFDALAAIMAEHGLVTLQLIWPKSKRKYFARNPFAGRGVVEDPATGARPPRSAATCGSWARSATRRRSPIRQGAEMGRPSLIEVSVIEGEPGVRLRGTATPISA